MAVTANSSIDDADFTEYPPFMVNTMGTLSSGTVAAGKEKGIAYVGADYDGWTRVGISSITISNTAFVVRAISNT